MKKLLMISLLTLAVALPSLAAETWTIDPVHSNVTFKVRHFVSKVSGQFATFSGTIVTDWDDLSQSSVELEIDTASIDTRHERRDKHLRSSDFFDAENHPKITFRSRSIEKTGKDRFDVTGDLTMRGITREIVLPVEYLGSMTTAPGRIKAGFTTEITIDRTDWNVNWNRGVEGGGFVLSDDVEITINIEADQKTE